MAASISSQKGIIITLSSPPNNSSCLKKKKQLANKHFQHYTTTLLSKAKIRMAILGHLQSEVFTYMP